MKKENVVRIAQVVISNREQLVVLRPVDRLLTVSILHYDAAVRPAAAFNDDLPDEDVSAQELKLAKMLIDTTRADDPELDQYHNLYNDRLEALVQAKIAGKEIASPPEEGYEAPRSIDFMQVLKDSLTRKTPGTSAGKRGTRTRPGKTKEDGIVTDGFDIFSLRVLHSQEEPQNP